MLSSCIVCLACFLASADSAAPSGPHAPAAPFELNYSVDTAGIIVNEIISIHESSAFTCRIGDFPPLGLKGIRVHVAVRGIKPHRNTDAEQRRRAAESAAKILKNARRITLKDIQLRNYFRMVADVNIDGKNLADELIKAKLAARDVPPAPVKPGGDSQIRLTTLIEPAAKIPQLKPLSEPGAGTDAVYTTGAIRRQLDRVVDLSALDPETPFDDALEIVRNSVQPPLPMLIMWRDIEENAFVERDREIGIEGMGNIRLRRALELLLLSAGAGAGSELAFVNDGGVITIATKELLAAKRANMVFDVAELAAPKANFDEYYQYPSGPSAGTMGTRGPSARSRTTTNRTGSGSR